MKSFVSTVVTAILGPLASTLWMVTWSAGNGFGGAYVTNGTVTIPMPNDKVAQQTAHDLNKEEEKAEKRKEKEEKKSGKK